MGSSSSTSSTVAMAMLLSAVASAPAAGQTADTNAPARRFDATAYVAWFAADRGDVGGDTYRDWFSTALGGAGVGYYWTEHLKTEVELSATGEDRLTSAEQEPIDSRLTRYTYRDHYYRFRTLSVLQSWQFLHNAWVHPFVGAGLDVIRESRLVEGRRQTFISSPVGASGIATEILPEMRGTRWISRPVALAGFKAYFARHGFFRTDVRAGIGSGLDEVTWRFGVGFDF